jgi:hypothetical protein
MRAMSVVVQIMLKLDFLFSVCSKLFYGAKLLCKRMSIEQDSKRHSVYGLHGPMFNL